ncbi:MAG: PTS sugar transporter subunit IIC/EAL domain-containing protein [Vitreoscilla sp.]|nr:PTS sugar transporter subunit IIC/EAL domain-containing protein [Vitreoscilla sp.]
MPPLWKSPYSRIALWALAVRDAYVVLLPLTFFGVAATLLQNLPGRALQAWVARVLGPTWDNLLATILSATYGVFGLTLAVVVGMQIARRLRPLDGTEPLPAQWAGISALVNFMLWVLARDGEVVEALGYGSMLTGMLIGIATPEMLRHTARWPLFRLANLRYDSDSLFYHAIRLSVPIIVNGVAVLVLALALRSVEAPTWQPFAALPEWANQHGDGVWVLSIVAILLNQTLWFLGIHGSEFGDRYAEQLYTPVGAPYDPHLAWHQLVDGCVNLGGSGATLGLLFALLIVAREGPQRRIAQFSLLPSIFNVNELLIYGVPIALNPIYLVPFVLAPLTLTLMSVAAVQSGLMPVLPVDLPWSMPPLLSGYLLTGSWVGPAFQLLAMGVSTAIYLPFARRAEAQRLTQRALAFAQATDAILADASHRLPAIERNDHVGVVARGLLDDLRHDLGTPALALAYQPKHNREGAAVGVEALLRWTHRRHGPIAPELALKLADEGGLTQSLGLWVMSEACSQKARLNALGLSGVRMAINISPGQLAHAELAGQIAGCLASNRLQSDEIELEITEGQPIPPGRRVDDTLHALVSMGVRLAMDDFGMGYSSLLHMRRFRIHVIKIDGSLTRDVLTNSTSADIIRTIATLGRAQQVEVVAEYVDNMPQRDALAALGCEVFQGYLHSPPLAPAACIEYLCRHRPLQAETAALST